VAGGRRATSQAVSAFPRPAAHVTVCYLSPELSEELLDEGSDGAGFNGAPLPSDGGAKLGRFPLGWVEHGA